MPSRIDIPLSINTNSPPALKSDLDRLVNEIDRWTRNLPNEYVERDRSASRGTITAVGFGVVNRLGPLDGEILNVQLPRPDPKNGGRRLVVVRATTTGMAVLRAVGCTINGAAYFGLRSHVHFVDVLFDGENYFTDDPGAVGWDGTVTP